MASTFPFLSVDDLTEYAFIGGTSQDLWFDVYTSASVAVNLSGATCSWELYHYGQPTPALTKVGTVLSSPSNRFLVHLDASDTSGSAGKFKQRSITLDSSGSTFKSQGIITIA